MIPSIDNNDFSEQTRQDLFALWLARYGDPDKSTLLYRFVEWAARSQWMHRRYQREYDLLLLTPEGVNHRLYKSIRRWLANAERSFKSDYRILNHHWKTRHPEAQDPIRKIPARDKPQSAKWNH